MNPLTSNKMSFNEDVYYPIYSVIYSDQNVISDIIFEEDFYEDEEFEDYDELEDELDLPILECPGADEYEA